MLEKLTKKELIDRIKGLEDRVSELEYEVDYWIDEWNTLDDELDKVNRELENLDFDSGIKDLDNFKFELSKNNLLSNEFEEFLENYLKYYND